MIRLRTVIAAAGLSLAAACATRSFVSVQSMDPPVGRTALLATLDGRQDPASINRFGLTSLRRWASDAELPAVFKPSDDSYQTSSVLEHYRSLVHHAVDTTCGEASRMIANVDKELAASASFDGGNAVAIRARLSAKLGALNAALSGNPADSALWDAIKGDSKLVPTQFEVAGGNDVAWFVDEPNFAFALAAYDKGATADDDPIPFTFVTPEVAIEVRSAIFVIQKLLDESFPLARINKALEANDLAWTNYLVRGYSQYPWESFVNGRIVPSGWETPPSWQLVLLHPEPALLADVRRSRGAQVDPALLVHGLGYVDYFGSQNDWFWGISATAALSGDADNGLGLGGTLHFGSTVADSAFPHLSIGAMWQDYGDGEQAISITFGLDAARYASSPNVGRVRELLRR